MKHAELKGRPGDIGGHYREMIITEMPTDLELVGVAHFYRLSIVVVVSMAHSASKEVRDSLWRLVADLPSAAIPDGLSALQGMQNPASSLRIERRVWANAMRLISDVLQHLQGRDLNYPGRDQKEGAA